MNQPQFRFIPSFLIVFLLLVASSHTWSKDASVQTASCLSVGWPHDQSDLKPDPTLLFGTLDNGVRYVIMPNHEPKGRVSLQLNIQAGSLHETEEQRGVAHYLEHMLFNGTTHYPPGTLVEYFQSIGMDFGSDSNAHTSYDETVYQLMLPNSEKKTLSDGLQVLADYAGGALLLPKEVDRERGIILSEKRQRDSAARRVFKMDMEQVFAGALLAKRDVIGTEEVLNAADAALLRQYYEQWYRPGNMMVVVVGDGDAQLIKELISQHFQPLKVKSGAAVACPDFGQVAESGTEAFYQAEADLGHAEVSISSVWNEPLQPFTSKLALQQLKEQTAAMMMNYRLERLTSLADSPLTNAAFGSGKMVRRLGMTSLEARTSADKWEQTLLLLNTSLRQVLTAGFAEAELKRAKDDMMTTLREQVQAAASRKSDELAAEIIRSLNDGEIVLSPEQEMAQFGPALEQLTLPEVNDAFRSLWRPRRVVKIAGTADLKGKEVKPEELIRVAFQKTETAELTPWTQQTDLIFPYLPEPKETAAVAQHVAYSKIGADRYVFSNGLLLNLKKTDFEPNELQVAVVFGKGELFAPNPGLSLLAGLLLPESGLGGMDKYQLKAALSRYSSTVQFYVDEDSFQFKGKGLTSETKLLFQLIHAYLYDPAFRRNALQRVQKQLEQMYAQMRGAVEGVMQLQGEQFLAGGNLRYGLPPLDAVLALTVADVKDWLAPALKSEPLEISVVGDFNQEEVLKLAGQYFGGQRSGGAPQQAEGVKIAFPAGKQLTLQVATASDKAQITVAWPTDDFWDIARTRRLNVLAAVLDDRLRKQIREELGAAYSPYVYNQSSTVDPGYGVLRSVLVAEPGQAAILADKLKQAGAQLAAGKVMAEELERALEPTLTSIRDMMRTNSYWLESVLIKSSRHPQRLAWPESLQSDFASIKPEEVAALAAKYLQPDKAAAVILLPEKK